MQGTNNVINFRWEKFKHSVKELIMRIRGYIIDIFGSKRKSPAINNSKNSYKSYSKKKKMKKFKY